MYNVTRNASGSELYYFANIHHYNVEVQGVCQSIRRICERYAGIKLLARSEGRLSCVVYDKSAEVCDRSCRYQGSDEAIRRASLRKRAA